MKHEQALMRAAEALNKRNPATDPREWLPCVTHAVEVYLSARATGPDAGKMEDAQTVERLFVIARTFRDFVQRIEGNADLINEVASILEAHADMFDAAPAGGA